MQVEFVSMTERLERIQFVARRFAGVIKGRVLDVGCDQAHLKRLVPGLDYTGIDFGGTPDLTVNLEQERLPFPDRDFDCVVCCDVLEHLDNLHQTFGELIRVCRGHVIVSLPNNWANARQPVARGRGRIGHYGLSPDAPKDRHKWFFSLEEAATFMAAQNERHPLEVAELFAVEKPRPALVRYLRRVRWRGLPYLNRYGHSVWALLRRKPTA